MQVPDSNNLRTKLTSARQCLRGITDLIQRVPPCVIETTAVTDNSISVPPGFNFAMPYPKTNYYGSSINPNTAVGTSSGSCFSPTPEKLRSSTTSVQIPKERHLVIPAGITITKVNPLSGVPQHYYKIPRSPLLQLSNQIEVSYVPPNKSQIPKLIPKPDTPRPVDTRKVINRPLMVDMGSSALHLSKVSKVDRASSAINLPNSAQYLQPQRTSTPKRAAVGRPAIRSNPASSSAIEFSVYPSGELDERISPDNVKSYFDSNDRCDWLDGTPKTSGREIPRATGPRYESLNVSSPIGVCSMDQSFSPTPLATNLNARFSDCINRNQYDSDPHQKNSNSFPDNFRFNPAANSTSVNLDTSDLKSAQDADDDSSGSFVDSALVVDDGPTDDQRNVGTQTKGRRLTNKPEPEYGDLRYVRGNKVYRYQRRFACSHCPKRYVFPSKLRHHVNSVHKNIRFKCDTCNEDFAFPGNLRSHIQIKHNNNGKPFTCKICKRDFTTHAQYVTHRSTHTLKRDIICPNCNCRFTNYEVEEGQIDEAAQNMEALECRPCDFRTQYMSSFKRHKSTSFHQRRLAEFKLLESNRATSPLAAGVVTADTVTNAPRLRITVTSDIANDARSSGVAPMDLIGQDHMSDSGQPDVTPEVPKSSSDECDDMNQAESELDGECMRSDDDSGSEKMSNDELETRERSLAHERMEVAEDELHSQVAGNEMEIEPSHSENHVLLDMNDSMNETQERMELIDEMGIVIPKIWTEL